MGIVAQRTRVAAVQAAPIFNDLDATTEKTIALIEDAAKQGAELVVFPETWIPGYPWFIWLEAPAKWARFVADYAANSLEIDSPQFRAIAEAARRHRIFVGLGHSERRNASLYMGQALIGDDGDLIFARRKLKPTHVERAVFGEGDGSDFHVSQTRLGRVGALCCWEHLQPLSKFAMYAANEQIHMAAWPSFCLYRDIAHTMSSEVSMAVTRVYAVEGQCFVVAATQVVSPEIFSLLADTDEKAALLNNRGRGPGGGYSMIFGPDGHELAAHLPEDQEGLVVADLDFSAIAMAKSAADPAGHYARPDVLRLWINREERQPVQEGSATALGAHLVPATDTGRDESAARGHEDQTTSRSNLRHARTG